MESLEFVMAPFLLIFGSPSPMEFYPQRIVKQSTFVVIHLSRKLLIPQIFFFKSQYDTFTNKPQQIMRQRKLNSLIILVNNPQNYAPMNFLKVDNPLKLAPMKLDDSKVSLNISSICQSKLKKKNQPLIL